MVSGSQRPLGSDASASRGGERLRGMWLMTTDGFFSAVQDRNDQSFLLVRTRVRTDADQLAEAIDGAVLETPDADYRFRVRVTKDVWARYVAGLAVAIDYDNFKNAVAARQGTARARVYGEVWSVLLDLQRQA